MILLPLLLAVHAAAEAPREIKPSRVFLKGVSDSSFTVIATPTDSSVNVWSLTTGRQVAHVDLPAFSPKKHDKDAYEVTVHSVRPDLKLILLSMKHWFYNPSFSNPSVDMYWLRSDHATYLASLEEGVPARKLWSGEGACGNYGFEYCPGINTRVEPSAILDDRPEVVVHGIAAASGRSASFRKTDVALAFDFKGRKLFENEVGYQEFNVVKGVEKSYPPFDEKKDDWISKDAQSCRVIKKGKTAAYLEGCTNEDYPSLASDGLTAASSYNSAYEYKVWDYPSGTLKLVFSPKRNDGWTTNSVWIELANGRIAATAKGPKDETRLEVWEPKSGRLIALGVGPEFQNLFSLRGKGSRLLYDRNDGEDPNIVVRTILVELGDAPPAAPAVAAAPKLDVDQLPAGAMKADPDAFAIVIGVEKYRSAGVPVVDYAARDAKTMAAYLGVMGFDAKNIAVLTDAEAGKVDFDKYFGKWLKNRVGPKSRVFIYYAGHGAPNPTTGAGYLMPYEADPSYLDETAYPVARLYAELAKLPTKDVTVVLDACFSGQGERSLIAKGTRPLVPVQAARGPENAAVIAAASGSQISASDHEARHGLLTYHLLAGLHGEADANSDGKITTSELFSYARPAVERAAKLQNVEQTPTVSGAAGAAGARVWTTLNKR